MGTIIGTTWLVSRTNPCFALCLGSQQGFTCDSLRATKHAIEVMCVATFFTPHATAQMQEITQYESGCGLVKQCRAPGARL